QEEVQDPDLRGRERLHQRTVDAVEQLDQRDVRQIGLRAGRPADQDGVAPPPSTSHRMVEQRGLADPGVALDKERARLGRLVADEALEGGDLLLTSDDAFAGDPWRVV